MITYDSAAYFYSYLYYYFESLFILVENLPSTIIVKIR